MVFRVVLVTVILAALGQISAALAMAVGLLLAILFVCMAMVWSAKRRNARERDEFQRVNSGYAEPDPKFLLRVWEVRH